MAYDYWTDYYDELEPVLVGTVAGGTATTQRINEITLDKMHRTADAYKLDRNETFRRKAKEARKQINQCREIIKNFIAQNRNPSSAGLDTIATTLHRIGDSLLLFSDRDSVVAADLQALIFQPATALQSPKMVLYFNIARSSQVDLYWNDLSWKLELALSSTLRYLDDTLHQNKIKFDSLYLLMSSGQYARAGRPFSAYVGFQKYPSKAGQLECFINGREYPVRQGLVEFDTVYSSPGYYQQQVDFRLTDPSANKKINYSKTFEFEILKP